MTIVYLFFAIPYGLALVSGLYGFGATKAARRASNINLPLDDRRAAEARRYKSRFLAVGFGLLALLFSVTFLIGEYLVEQMSHWHTSDWD